MSDNVTTQSTDSSAVPLGTIIATEDSGGGVQVQRVKITWGIDGTCTNPTSGSGLPVKITGQSSNIAVDVNTLPTVTLSSGTQTIGTVLGNFSLTSSTLVIGAVSPSSQWIVTTTPSSRVPVDVNTLPSVTLTSGTQTIGTVLQGTSPWVSSLTSGTQVIGSVLASSIWTVNQGLPPWSVTLTSGTLALGTVTLSSGTQVIGSVAPSSQWTVTSVLTSGTLALGTVTLSSGTQVIGSVAPSSQWTVTSVLTSGTLALGTVNVSSGTVTLTSGTLALGTVTLSSGTQKIGSVAASTIWTVAAADDVSVLMTSGTALTPNYANVTTSSTLVTLVSTTSAKITTVLSFAFSVNSTSTAAAFSAQFTSSLGSTDKTYSSKFFFPTNGVTNMIYPYNPIGWAQTTSSGNLSLQISAGVAGPGLGCLLTYVSQ